MNRNPVRRLALLGLTAAVYAALTLGLAPISYGPLQFRLSEALCVLPYFFPPSAWALFAGCLLANLLSQYGVLDIVFGSLATLLAGLCTAAIGRSGRRESWPRCVAACLMPVVFNAVIVGAVIAYSAADPSWSAPFWLIFLGDAASVGFGELVVLFVLGLPLMRALPKSGFYGRLVERL